MENEGPLDKHSHSHSHVGQGYPLDDSHVGMGSDMGPDMEHSLEHSVGEHVLMGMGSNLELMEAQVQGMFSLCGLGLGLGLGDWGAHGRLYM